MYYEYIDDTMNESKLGDGLLNYIYICISSIVIVVPLEVMDTGEWVSTDCCAYLAQLFFILQNNNNCDRFGVPTWSSIRGWYNVCLKQCLYRISHRSGSNHPQIKCKGGSVESTWHMSWLLPMSRLDLYQLWISDDASDRPKCSPSYLSGYGHRF